jgi:hypothetical protein
MKNVALIASVFASMSVAAQNVQLVVEQVDNQALVPGNTYRVYAQLPSAEYSLHAVFGDSESSLIIESTAPFYQHSYGGNTAMNVNAAVLGIAPELAYDSWITIGKDHGNNNNLWDAGITYNSFADGNALLIQDGAWFLLPTDPQTKEGQNNLILIAQLTTTGIASGVINMQGWDGENKPWRLRGLTFSTSNAQVLGCTDVNAENYNANATYNDGSCQVAEGGNNSSAPVAEAPALEDETKWTIFPNPVFEGIINIQFDQVLDAKAGNVLVNIYDMAGKMVFGKEINEGNVVGGNRIILNTDLAAGSYQVNVIHAGVSSAQMIVVQR